MKYLWGFLAFFGVTCIALYFLLFTSSGNDILKPYVEKQLQKRLQTEIQLASFTLRSNFIDLEILSQNKSRVILNGDFSLWSRSFDLAYIFIANNLQMDTLNLKGLFALKGSAKGSIDDFLVQGEGEIFKAKTNFEAHIAKKFLQSITLHSTGIQVEEVLAFLQKPLYTKGIVDIDTKILPNAQNELSGDGTINIQFGQINADVIEKHHSLKLPSNITYRGDITYKVISDIAHVQTNISSSIAKIETQETRYDIKSQKFQSDFLLSIINLTVLKEVLGLDLFGSVKIEGNILKTKEKLSLNATSNLLGGVLNATLEDKKANLHVKDIYLAELLKMFKQEPYMSGKLGASVDVKDIDTLDFVSQINTDEAKLNAEVLSKLLEKKLPQDIPFKVELKAQGKDKNSNFEVSFDSKLLDMKVKEGIFDAKNQKARGKYSLHVEDLSGLDFLVGQKVYAKLETLGEFRLDETFGFNGESDFLGAKTSYALTDNVFTLTSNEVLIQNITKALRYPNVFESYASLSADYNLTSQSGKFNVEAINGKLTSSELTNLVQLFTQFDMTQEVYKQSILKGLIEKDMVDFVVSMEGLNSHMKVENGKYNLASKDINSNFEVKIQKKDLKGTIKGNINNPKVKIDDSVYLKQKIDKAIDKNVPEEWREPAKELLKLFG